MATRMFSCVCIRGSVNEDLWDAPFDTELETLAHAFKTFCADYPGH